MSYESAIFNDVSGTGLRATPTLTTWTETYTFFDEVNLVTNTSGANDPNTVRSALRDAYQNNTSMVVVGNAHRIYPQTYAIDVQVIPFNQNSSTHVRQIVTWAQPGPQCSVQYDTYQQSTDRTFAVDATRGLRPLNLTAIPYIPTGVGESLGTNFGLPFIASIRVPSVLISARVTQWEVALGELATFGKTPDIERFPIWNTDGIWGCDPGTLLYMGRKSVSDGTPLVQRTYTFLKNPVGWHHFYASYRLPNGFMPRDITPIDPASIRPSDGSKVENGAAAFKMLVGLPFADKFTHLRLPFNTGSNPPESNIPNTIGDFPNPVMPDNTATV